MEQVIGNCFVCIIACYSGESKCSGDLWRRTKKLQDWRTCWCGGWVLGRVANRRGDCWQVPRILWIIGEISAWISRSSVGVVLSAPVTSPPPELRCKMKSIHPRYYVAGPIHSWPPPAATHSDPMSGLFSARPSFARSMPCTPPEPPSSSCHKPDALPPHSERPLWRGEREPQLLSPFSMHPLQTLSARESG